MKYSEKRPFADPDKAARRIIEIANEVEPVQDRIHNRKDQRILPVSRQRLSG